MAQYLFAPRAQVYRQSFPAYGRNTTYANPRPAQFIKTPAQFLNEFSAWFRRKEDTSIAERIHAKVVELGKEAQTADPTPKPEDVEGRHVTASVDDIKELKRQGKLDEAEKILLEIVDTGTNAPWYYEQLAIIYRKQKDYDQEVAILERFAKQEHAPGAKPQKLKERLERAKELQKKAKSKAQK